MYAVVFPTSEKYKSNWDATAHQAHLSDRHKYWWQLVNRLIIHSAVVALIVFDVPTEKRTKHSQRQNR